MNDQQEVQDNIETTTETISNVPARRPYKVLVETGLFKNGQQYNQGDIVELDVVTAERFKALGEIEDAE